jgi:hypothetical protein
MTYIHAGTTRLQPGNPQPGPPLAGVLDRYTISETPHGPVRTVIVTEEPTGEQIGLRLVSTHVLALFAAVSALRMSLCCRRRRRC